jgi:RimJ/RimL family protein N-acetyltransferase
VLAGVALNGESLYWLQLAGAVLVLAGIWGVTKGGTEKSEGKPKFIVESERLYLRLLEPGDTAALMRVWGDPEVMKYCGGAATEDRIRQIIQMDRGNYKKYGNTIFAVMEKASDKLIGITGCKIEEDKPRQGELIAHFAKDAWGKGYATEIIKAYIEWNKEQDLLDYIFASVMPDNAISLNMARKAGFKQNGFVQFEDTGFVDEPFFEIFLKHF